MQTDNLFNKICFGLIACLLTVSVSANPVGGSVASGNIAIQQTGDVTTINQTSQKGIINWQSFNIGANQATHYIQPSNGITLNRINPTQGASQIYGTLTATGRVILLNPAGIYFGPSAYVNVGGLIASTGSLTDQDFLNNRYQFKPVAGFNGSIINDGTLIAAQHGLIALLGNSVQNNGLIEASLGTAALGSGRGFSLTFSGNDLISFTVDEAVIERGVDKNGDGLPDGVKNTGSIIAEGGRVMISARAAAGILDRAINMDGFLQARSVTKETSGAIILSTDPQNSIRIASKIDASGKEAGLKGGQVSITGGNLFFETGTIIDVSGNVGGGSIQIGRDTNGVLANMTQFQPGVSLLARTVGGNGGLIETSGNQLRLEQLLVDTTSSLGQTGQWLLDPLDLTICVSCSSDTSTTALLASTLLAALDLNNVTLTTSGTGVGSGTGSIFVKTPITWSNANRLTLSAFKNITVEAPITNTAGGSLVLRADNTGTGIGTLSFLSGANLTMTGGGSAKIYYNPTVFGIQDTLYAGGTPATQYMLIHALGSEFDTLTPSLATVSNTSGLWNESFALSKDIDASSTATWANGAGFSPIGNLSTAYTGFFDGLGHLIKNLTINRPVESNLGLFGITGSSADIRQLGVHGVIHGLSNAGVLVGFNQGNLAEVFSAGQVIGSLGANLGGLIGFNAGIVTDVYSTASVNAPDAINVGGLVGANGFSGLINRAFAIGYTAGSSEVGGLVGTNTGSLTNSFWDIASVGQPMGVGNNAGINSTTSGTILTLMQATPFSNAGWDMANTWGVIAGKSYPYLKNIYDILPRAITGTLSTTNSFDNILYPNTNQTIALAAAGTVLSTTQTGANGDFYFLERNNLLRETYPFLTFVKDSAIKANTISLTPLNGASVSAVSLKPHTVLVADNGIFTPLASEFAQGINLYEYIKNNPSNLGVVTLFLMSLDQTDATLIDSLPIISGEEIYKFMFGVTPFYREHSGFMNVNYYQFYGSVATPDQTGYHFNFTPTIADNDIPNYKFFHPALTLVNNFITNDALIEVMGGLSGADLLYTANGSNVTLKPNTHFETTANLQYGLTGNLITTSGSIRFGGPLQVGPFANPTDTVTVKTNGGGNINIMDLVTWTQGGAETLFFDSANTIFINKPILGVVDDVEYNPLSNGSVAFSAAYTDQSITTSLLGRIYANQFSLRQGKWYQGDTYLISTLNYTDNTFVPYHLVEPLIVVNDFRIGMTPGVLPSDTAEFIRVLGGEGTPNNPYLIGDIFGLQGIGSSMHMLGASYQVAHLRLGSDNFSYTDFWNDGQGFIPIGTLSAPFTGTVDGLFDTAISTIAFIWSDYPNQDQVGLFGVTGSSAVIKNLGLSTFGISGRNQVGALVGYNQGTIDNIQVGGPSVFGQQDVGGLVGLNSGSITNISIGGLVKGITSVGGVVGSNLTTGSIDKVLALSLINGSAGSVGGVAGSNAGMISNSFWNTDSTGIVLGVGSNQGTISLVTGGCWTGQCSNGGTAALFSSATYSNVGWNFSDTAWGIVENKSYPYLAAQLGLANVPGFEGQRVVPNLNNKFDLRYGFHPNYPQVFSGQLNPGIALQSFYFITLPFDTPGSSISLGTSAMDGSFYISLLDSNLNTNMEAILFVMFNGNATGAAIVRAPAPFEVFDNITIPVTELSSLPNNPAPLSFPEMIAIINGLDYNFFLNNPSFSVTSVLIKKDTRAYILAQAEVALAAYRAYLNYSVLYNPFDIESEGDGVYSIDIDLLNQFVKENIKEIQSDTFNWNKQFLKKYEIEQVKQIGGC